MKTLGRISMITMSRTKLPISERTGTVPAGSASEEIRLRFLYRSMIQRGKVRISLSGALGLIGPDCAFHLYSAVAQGNSMKKNQRNGGKGRR